MLQPGVSVEEQFKKITTRIVNLEEGRFATEAELAEIKAAGGDAIANGAVPFDGDEAALRRIVLPWRLFPTGPDDPNSE